MVNCAIWGYIAYDQNVNDYFLFPYMIIAGLFGGTIYANVLYMLLKDRRIKKREKEIAVNILNIFNFLGIICGASLSLILVNTIYSDIK